MSTPDMKYYCDYNTGCVLVSYKKACPAGQCCIDGGNWEKQSCLPGYECCFNEVQGDPFRGLCKTSCSAQPDDPTAEKTRCEAQGGKWVEETKETGLIFKETTTTGECRMARTPLIAVLMIIAGFVILGIMAFS